MTMQPHPASGPEIAVGSDNGLVTVKINDDELCDFVEDCLTETHDGMEVQSRVGRTLYLVASAELAQVQLALSALSKAEINRIWLLNNAGASSVQLGVQPDGPASGGSAD